MATRQMETFERQFSLSIAFICLPKRFSISFSNAPVMELGLEVSGFSDSSLL